MENLSAQTGASSQRARLLRQALAKKGITVSEERAIEKRRGDGPCRLSFAQQRLWFLNQLHPDSASYNICNAIRLRGPLEVDALEKTVAEIVRRHESLRTTFHKTEQGPVQRVSPPEAMGEAVKPIIDLGDLDEFIREQQLDRSGREAAMAPFDLANGPCFRIKVIRLSDQDHIAFLVMHHIISDGWSMDLLVHEVSVLYDAFRSGRPSPLKDLPIQYGDYAEWQRGWLEGERLNRQLKYWEKQLDGAPPTLDLPSDRPRPEVESFEADSRSIQLDGALTKGLKALAEQEGVTLFMALLAAFQTFLHRLSGQQDIVVGSFIANRRRAELEGLIGFFVNTLVFRTGFEPAGSGADPTVREVLARVRATALAAYDHQDIPFDQLVSELRPERVKDRNPIFQIGFALHHEPQQRLRLPGLELSSFPVGKKVVNFDMSLEATETVEGLRCSFIYKRDLFEAASIERMARRFMAMLRAFVETPSLRVRDLPLLTGEEREQLLVEWNRTERVYPRERGIHHLFEEQARRRPEQIAVRSGDEQIRYESLNAQANQLARRLRAAGVENETPVAICLPRGVQMIVALLAVMKSGGCYVPVDLNLPLERQGYLLQDAGVRVLVTRSDCKHRLAPFGSSMVLLDEEAEQIALLETSNLELEIDSESLAYILYTSGSTGRPKGVMIPHRGVVNYLCWSREAYRAEEGRGSIVHSPLGFDLTVTSLLTPLVSGQCVWLASEEESIEGLGRELARGEDFTLLKLTPSHLEMLRWGAGEGVKGKTRTLVIGGEELREESLKFWRERAPGTRLMNEYGPTETVVGCSAHDATEEGAESGATPIGRPIWNARMYVLGPQQEPSGIGVEGEIYIGGEVVGRGYVGKGDQTAERFVPDPYSPVAGARMYRSGDQGRVREDGVMEYLGRRDGQVKLRGHRIELGEIEEQLRKIPGVAEAAAAIKGEGAEKRLVGYVVEGGREVSERELKESVERTLPSYMRPAVYVKLAKLPLTLNGKVDRGALPQWEQSEEKKAEDVEPRTPAERELAEIWIELLGLKRVSVHDNFFELGGHSLLLTQLAARLSRRFNVEAPLKTLFDAPTIDQMSRAIADLQLAQEGLETVKAPALERVPRDRELPLSFEQQRLWFLHQLDPQSPAYNQSAAIKLIGRLDQAALENALGEIVRRHESLRTNFQSKGGTPFLVIQPAQPFSLPVTALTGINKDRQEESARHLMTEEALRPFDLAGDRLLRARLIRFDEQEHVVVFILHHIISDGWSVGMFVRELSSLYEAFLKGVPSPLPEPPIQYADYAYWQRGYLQGEALDSKLAYWKKELDGVRPTLDLPTDRPRPAKQSYRGAQHRFALSEELSANLKALSVRQQTTPFMTLLAAFNVLLHRYSGERDITVGAPTAGRNRVELESLIGFFINTLVLRTRLDGDPTFRRLLAQVRRTTLGAFAHQDIPFEKIVEALQPERALSRMPLFQTLFALNNTPDAPLELPGLRLEPFRASLEASKFDLALYMEERDAVFFGCLQFSADLFEAPTIARMADQFIVLLENIVDDPDRPLSGLALVRDQTRARLTSDFNDEL